MYLANVVVDAGDFIVQADYLRGDERHLGNLFDASSDCEDDGAHLSKACSERKLFVANTLSS